MLRLWWPLAPPYKQSPSPYSHSRNPRSRRRPPWLALLCCCSLARSGRRRRGEKRAEVCFFLLPRSLFLFLFGFSFLFVWFCSFLSMNPDPMEVQEPPPHVSINRAYLSFHPILPFPSCFNLITIPTSSNCRGTRKPSLRDAEKPETFVLMLGGVALLFSPTNLAVHKLQNLDLKMVISIIQARQ